ncbi:hypothetical protein K0M31_011091, partial [Melipona bicolor]
MSLKELRSVTQRIQKLFSQRIGIKGLFLGRELASRQEIETKLPKISIKERNKRSRDSCCNNFVVPGKTKLKGSSNEKGKNQDNGESERIAAIKELIKGKRVNESDKDVLGDESYHD